MPRGFAGCIAGALSRREYLNGLAAAGFAGASVTFTHKAAPGCRYRTWAEPSRCSMAWAYSRPAR
jgi:hypothetical protein